MAVKDLAFPTIEEERLKCKRNKTIPRPNGYFITVFCKPCNIKITAYSHSQTVRTCPGCRVDVLRPTGGKAKPCGNSRFKENIV